MANELTEQERRVFTALRTDYIHYAKKCLVIRPKNGKIAPFTFNKAQEYLHHRIEEQKRKTGMVRALALKGRQQGVSTYVGGRFYWLTTQNRGFKTFILAHMSDATDNLFKMVKRYHEHCPDIVKAQTTTTNRKELVFNTADGKGLDSGYALGTAGSPDVGRSDTIQLFHGSEVAFWTGTDGITTGVMQTIPNERGTEIILESTANGVGGFFHSQWQQAEAGESEYQAIFIPWYWQDEYASELPDDFSLTTEELELKDMYSLADEQLCWRRNKIVSFMGDGSDGVWKFRQEYPFNPIEAFQTSGEDSLIKPETVLLARKFTAPKQKQANIIGVDPARFGKDRTSIAWRNGRDAYEIKYYSKKDTMEVAGICADILLHERIDRMFIDIGGLGAGVVDRLIELGHGHVVTGMNFGERATYSERYVNKRCEMWGEMSRWLKEGGCSIPDDNELHADLVGPNYGYDSAGRLKLESKEDMAKRGLRSPDGADALALTFAFPVASPAVANAGIHVDAFDWNPLKQKTESDMKLIHKVLGYFGVVLVSKTEIDRLIESSNRLRDEKSMLQSSLFMAEELVEFYKRDKRTLNGRVELMRKACLIFEKRESSTFSSEEMELIRTMATQFNYMYGED